MMPIPLNEETAAIANQIIWFEPAAEALSNPIRFMAYAMTYAMHEEMRVIRRYVSDDDFREALDGAPPGIIDARSWAYWNSKMGRFPPPPLPVRRFGNTLGPDVSALTRSHENGNPELMQRLSLEEVRSQARTTWRRKREQVAPAESLDEVRRRAREEWRAKYGPGTSES
jgi:hypothetical protein